MSDVVADRLEVDVVKPTERICNWVQRRKNLVKKAAYDPAGDL